MLERQFEPGSLWKLANAALAFQTWLKDGVDSADTDGLAREAHRQLRALSETPLSAGATHIYDAHGRLTQTTDAPVPADYSLRLGDAGEVLVATRADVFVFVLDARGVHHFVARRQPARGASEGDRPS